MNDRELKSFLDDKYWEFSTSNFIEHDPVFVIHQFSKLQDIEIAGFFAATFAWGQRSTILKKSLELMQLMENAPHDFVLNAKTKDLKALQNFKHRTFNYTDLTYFVTRLKKHYTNFNSLESAFNLSQIAVKERLTGFYNYFFDIENHPDRCHKHVASPEKKSTCKRLNMYLRWMVRNDGRGIDLGLWKEIPSSQLMIPFDVHVARVARKLGLIARTQNDWQAVEELTAKLRKYDAEDPVKYDFALFGLGVIEKFV